MLVLLVLVRVRRPPSIVVPFGGCATSMYGRTCSMWAAVSTPPKYSLSHSVRRFHRIRYPWRPRFSPIYTYPPQPTNLLVVLCCMPYHSACLPACQPPPSSFCPHARSHTAPNIVCITSSGSLSRLFWYLLHFGFGIGIGTAPSHI